MRLLRTPKSYACRLYVVKGLHLQPKDMNGLADPYIRCKVDMENGFCFRMGVCICFGLLRGDGVIGRLGSCVCACMHAGEGRREIRITRKTLSLMTW